MNTKRLQETIKTLLAVADWSELDISLYFPSPSPLPWEPSLRYMAWDCYGVREVDTTEMVRRGSKAYYIEHDPLSIILAKQQLLRSIAITLKVYYLHGSFAQDSQDFVAMLGHISAFVATELRELACETQLSH